MIPEMQRAALRSHAATRRSVFRCDSQGRGSAGAAQGLAWKYDGGRESIRNCGSASRAIPHICFGKNPSIAYYSYL